ncbi:FAD-binding oxidoreductase [Virgibacillus siamensis]
MITENLINSFQKICGNENVYHTTAAKLAYSYDATANFQSMPDLVISPRNTEEVISIVRLCKKHTIPIVPRGSGTNLAAGTAPTSGGIVILFKNMNQILELDEENMTITVQPGIITNSLINFVEKKDLFYPPDPSSKKISTIGGNISENSGGLRGLKYGVTKDYVLGLEAVLPNGETIKTGGKLAKDVAGYDLTKLLVGSEGTLAIITEATLKLLPKPEYQETILAMYHSMEDAAETVSAILASRIIPTTLEFIDRGTLRIIEGYKKIGLPTDCEAVLLIEQDGTNETVRKDMAVIYNICNKYNAFEVQKAETKESAEDLRTARRDALSALAKVRPTTILEDATVPRSRVAPMVREIIHIAEKYEVLIRTFGHAGDGNLHPTCLTDIRDQKEMERVEKALEDIFNAAIKLGGTITGEHGVGEMKAPFLEWKIGKNGIAVMKAIKTAIDPDNIMNPGKIFAKSTKKRVVVNNV